MGSLLVPVLANLFMGHHEKFSRLQDLKASEALFYLRKHYFSRLLNYIKFRHSNIRFSHKERGRSQVTFFDALIDDSDAHYLVTRIYRKRTFTGLLTNYFSFTFHSCKLDLVRTFVDSGARALARQRSTIAKQIW